MAKASKSGKSNTRLDTPTDLSGNATPEIAAALNGCLADAFALYVKTKNFSLSSSISGVIAVSDGSRGAPRSPKPPA